MTNAKMSLIITDMSSDVKQELSSSSTNASILTHTDFKVKRSKVTGWGHIVAAT